MAKVNVKVPSTPHKTHEGGPAARITDEQALRRSVLACLLWEKQFYEDGASIAERIAKLVPKVAPHKVAALAVEAREAYKLRHAPLLLAREMVRTPTHRALVADTLSQIIQRPDELTEFLAIYWMGGKTPIAAQAKKGLARAFTKFDEYQLAKYNRDAAIKLRDVLFLSHAKPKDALQAAMWRRLVDGELTTPDTWEVALSGGADKKETFERLIREKKLGALALLRNLRNMTQAKVDESVIRDAVKNMNVERILPYRFIAAASHARHLEDVLETAMLKCLGTFEKMPGKTKLLIDISGSMDVALSTGPRDGWRRPEPGELSRLDAACGIAMLAREICDEVEVYTFSNRVARVAPRRGFALKEAIFHSQDHSGTYLGKAVSEMNTTPYDRLIVFTDEQSADAVPAPKGTGYMINVASAEKGVGYGAWKHIDGFSEAAIKWIQEYEKADYAY